MHRFLATALALTAGLSLTAAPQRRADRRPPKPTQGTLAYVTKGGEPMLCPLKHTDVRADISGPIARVTVTQEFFNPTSEVIEAVYTFPLPHRGAVDDMTMKVGDRTISGVIKKKEDARKIYENARNNGQTAALLDQERPNIFNQSVANIPPGGKVEIQIRYLEAVPYEAGTYEFVFPMVVAPRYIPASVSDGDKISPPVTPPGTRAGHDISVSVNVDAGMDIQKIESPTHEVDVKRPNGSHATVALKDQASIPNKDFLLRYTSATGKIQDAILTHADAKGGYFTLMLQPPARPANAEITPKEIVFLIDTSGSMHGFPLDKIKETMRMAFDGLHPKDTFNLITFSGDEHVLFKNPVPATRENIDVAWKFLNGQRGSGGTEMMKGIKAALDPSDAQDHIRITCFMTDGEVGNDDDIIREVKKHQNARVFAFGIGSSVNRYLLDNIARFGRGEVEYVGLGDDGSAAAKRFHERVQKPLLTDVWVDWNNLPVGEMYPSRIPDLFSAKPLVITGRYTGAVKGTIKLHGKVAGRDFVREIQVNFSANEPAHEALPSLWARAKVAELECDDFRNEKQEPITQLGLDYRMMTKYTSFVAVEDRVVNEGGRQRRVQVPVEMPAGMSYRGVYGDRDDKEMNAPRPSMVAQSSGRGGAWFGGRTASPPAIMPERDMSVRKSMPEPISQPEQKSKMDSTLQRADAGTTYEVLIAVVDLNPAVLARLKSTGLQIVSTQGGVVRAKATGAQLLKLASMAEVTSIRPVA